MAGVPTKSDSDMDIDMDSELEHEIERGLPANLQNLSLSAAKKPTETKRGLTQEEEEEADRENEKQFKMAFEAHTEILLQYERDRARNWERVQNTEFYKKGLRESMVFFTSQLEALQAIPEAQRTRQQVEAIANSKRQLKHLDDTAANYEQISQWWVRYKLRVMKYSPQFLREMMRRTVLKIWEAKVKKPRSSDATAPTRDQTPA